VTFNLPNRTSSVCMRSPSSTAVAAATETYAERWRQLVCGIFCMVMIANLQYGWTLFVHPIDQKFHWGTTAIQVAFSIFIALRHGWYPLKDGSWTVSARGSSWPPAAFASHAPGRLIPSRLRFGSCTWLPLLRAPAPEQFMAPVSETRSSGFPICAA